MALGVNTYARREYTKSLVFRVMEHRQGLSAGIRAKRNWSPVREQGNMSNMACGKRLVV